jgi:hypothetical protein
MKLLNATGMAAGCTLGMEPSGAEHLVVAVKGTFTLPASGREPLLAEEQVPLVDADAFSGAPGLSSPTAECDHAPWKPRCDVLLNGSAYAPAGRPAARVPVGIRIGGWQKTFAVVGNRTWRAGGLGATRPEPFEVMPISYDNAFGGPDDFHPDASRHRSYRPNPVGRGYHSDLAPELVNGTPLPNTEENDAAVQAPNGRYAPMAFGPVGRGWLPRYKLAGTYDQNWIDNIFPFLPPDFDPAYYQSAPPDQQIERIEGGEPVLLGNLTSDGRRSFHLPRIEVPIVFFRRRGGHEERKGRIDTLLIEPDRGRFSIVWRASLPLRKNVYEVTQIVTGRMSRAWWRSVETGKTYYPSLGRMVGARARRAAE